MKIARLRYVSTIATGLAIGSMLLLAGTAIAASMPTEHATGSFLDAARSYWGRMLPGREPPCPTSIMFVDEQQMAAKGWDPANSAMGDVWGCRIWLKRSFWISYDETDPTPCAIVVHEYGHNLGLGHTPNYPIMSDYPIPPECGGPTDQGNPHLAHTTVLYERKRILRAKLLACRTQRQHCQMYKRNLNRVRDSIAQLEGVWRY